MPYGDDFADAAADEAVRAAFFETIVGMYKNLLAGVIAGEDGAREKFKKGYKLAREALDIAGEVIDEQRKVP